MMINDILKRLRRAFHRQRAVAVTTLSGMVVCEQRVVLERLLGPRVTKAQRRASEAGRTEHRRQDAAVRYHMTSAPLRQALLSGLVVGLPLTLVGEIMLHLAAGEMTAMRVMGRVLTAPAGIYEAATGANVFTSGVALAIYVSLQWAYYATVAYALMVFTHAVRSD